MNKFIALFIAIVLSFGIVSSCSGAKEKKITIILKTPTLVHTSITNPEITDTAIMFEYASQKFSKTEEGKNVEIKIEQFAYEDEMEAINGCYGTRDAADVIYEGYFNMASYVSEGHVVPLDDIISDELRKDISNVSWQISSYGGKTYMMPYLSMQNILTYNKDLFRECGLDEFVSSDEQNIIQNWTLEEWNYILDTLAEKLPKDKYPIMMYAKSHQGDMHIMTLMRSHGGNIYDNDGNFNFENEDVIKAIKWIQDGIEKGWYPPYCALLEIIDSQKLFDNGQLAIFLTNNSLSSINDSHVNCGYVNFPNNLATSFITGFEVFDNGDEQKIKASKDFIKFIYTDKELLELSAGNIPECKSVSEKYKGDIFMLDEYTKNMSNVWDFMNGCPNWQGNDGAVRHVFYPVIQKLLQGKITPTECAQMLDEACNKAISIERKYHE